MLFRSAVLVAWVVWFGGWTLLKRALPADMTSNVFDDSGDVRVAMPKPDPNGAPWKQKAYDPDDDDHGKAKAKKGAADDEDSDDDDSPAADKDNAQVNAALCEASLLEAWNEVRAARPASGPVLGFASDTAGPGSLDRKSTRLNSSHT